MDSDWEMKIRRNYAGKIETDVGNLCYILENDPALNEAVRKNARAPQPFKVRVDFALTGKLFCRRCGATIRTGILLIF